MKQGLSKLEQAFVNANDSKWNSSLYTALKMVKAEGKVPNKWWMEALEMAGMIVFGGPRPEIGSQFNCFHLTDKGQAQLAELDGV